MQSEIKSVRASIQRVNTEVESELKEIRPLISANALSVDRIVDEKSNGLACIKSGMKQIKSDVKSLKEEPVLPSIFRRWKTVWRSSIIWRTRNILKKDIRRLSNTDDKRNQIRWFRRNSHLPLCMLESNTREVVVLFLSLFCFVLCTSNFFR